MNQGAVFFVGCVLILAGVEATVGYRPDKRAEAGAALILLLLMWTVIIVMSPSETELTRNY